MAQCRRGLSRYEVTAFDPDFQAGNSAGIARVKLELENIPTKFFEANSAFSQVTLFAYNLLNCFKRLCLPKECRRMSIESLRHRLLAVPAELIYPQGRPALKLSECYPDKNAFLETLNRIKKLKKRFNKL